VTTPEQHVEVCIATLNALTEEYDHYYLPDEERVDLGLELEGCLANLLCGLYFEEGSGSKCKDECPGGYLCKHKTFNGHLFMRFGYGGRQSLERAFRYHAGRAK